jgi:ATP-binding cassette subfamily F protein 3
LLQLQDVTKAFGDKTLLEHVTWQVGDRDRVGLCGPNGAGKTTLLKMLAGFDEPDDGFIQKPNSLTLGYLPQDGLSHSGRTVKDEASLALKPLLDLKAEMHALEERLGDATVSEAEHETILTRYSEVQDRFRLGDGYQIELKVATVLRGLGFEPEAQDQLTDHLSGGWQMRVALAKLLLSEPDLLLLDEPTNHLDLDARNWLEEYLVAYPHAVILVSHDRYFLDAVVTHIADLTLRKITEYHTNYTKYLEQREANLERLREAKRRQDEEIQRVEEFINRFRYQATKAAQVQSRIKMLDKVERLEVPPERKRIHFQFPAAPKSGRMVLELKDVRKAYGDKIVLDRVNLHIERGDRIALVGHNGAGKSTLMRILSGEEAPDRGTRTEGHQVVMQYFAQDEATRLNPVLTVHDTLSGGERTRLAVARMLLRPSNTLLLDEPTNHLDIDSKEVLLDALADYGGTLIFVSHDRYFVERLATKIIDVGNGKAILYPGTYESFLWSKEQGEAQAGKAGRAGEAGKERRSSQPAPPAPPAPPAHSYSDRKQASAERSKRERAFKALKNRVTELEARIADREKAIKDVEQKMAAADFYNDHEKSKPVLAQHQELMWEVGELLSQWEMLQGEAEQYSDLRNS